MAFSQAGLNHEEARTNEQRALMAQIEADGVCPFCAEHFRRYHPKPIIRETASWFVSENMSPYEGTSQHFIFVYKPAHITSPAAMSPDSQVELFSLIGWVVQEYNLPGGSFFMRFGDGAYNGSSVEHLHAHLIIGGNKSAGTDSLKVKLGYKTA